MVVAPLLALAALITTIVVASRKKAPAPIPPPALPPAPTDALDPNLPPDVRAGVMKALVSETEPKKLVAYATSLMPDFALAARALTEKAKTFLSPAAVATASGVASGVGWHLNMPGFMSDQTDIRDPMPTDFPPFLRNPDERLVAGVGASALDTALRATMQRQGLAPAQIEKALRDVQTRASSIPNRLNPGQSIQARTDPKMNRASPHLASSNGRAWLILQSDGNLVLSQSGGKVLWSSKTSRANLAAWGKNPPYLILQHDGNLVLFSGTTKLWSTNTWRPGDPKRAWGGNPPHLILGDDGNLVLFSGKTHLWSTQSNGFQNRQDEAGWLENAAKTAGKAWGSAADFVADVSTSFGDKLGSVPLIGPGLKGFYGYTYGALIESGAAIASGVRPDKVVSRHLEAQVQNVKGVAPYVQTVIALVPGIGPGISGAISGGLSLVQGRSIDQAILDAAVGAIPGGALAQSVAKFGIAMAQGKRVDQAAMDAAVDVLPVPPAAKEAIKAAKNVLLDAAAGKRVDQALLAEANKQIDKLPAAARDAVKVGISVAQGNKVLDAAMDTALDKLQMAPQTKQALKSAKNVLMDAAAGKKVDQALLAEANKQVESLPGPARDALKVGIALGEGKKLQDAAKKALPTLMATGGPLMKSGLEAAQKNAVVQQARNVIEPATRKGFDLGTGLMKTAASPPEIARVRDAIKNGADLKAFDTAVALHTAAVVRKPIAAPPAQQAGYLVLQGMRGQLEDNTLAVAKTLAQDPATKEGAARALQTVTTAKREDARERWTAHYVANAPAPPV